MLVVLLVVVVGRGRVVVVVGRGRVVVVVVVGGPVVVVGAGGKPKNGGALVLVVGRVAGAVPGGT